MLPRTKYAVPSKPDIIETIPKGVKMNPRRKKVVSEILDLPSFVFHPLININTAAANSPTNIVVNVD